MRMTLCTANGPTPLEAPAAGTEGTSVELRNVEIERSPADSRDYRAVMLDNGLEALVVSDPHAGKAAAVNVNVGSGDDPDDRPGLAHFLEHMLFLGTGKYPDAGEYDRFLAEHGGSGNAATSFAHTSFFFDVDAAHLEGALDRFAWSFISPRFDRGYVERERQVVHSEFVSRRRDDRVRSFAAWRQTLDPRHPLSRFLAGNAETLADRPGADVRDALIAFHESRYSSHLMKLVMVGREPLDVLTAGCGRDSRRYRVATSSHRASPCRSTARDCSPRGSTSSRSASSAPSRSRSRSRRRHRTTRRTLSRSSRICSDTRAPGACSRH